MIKKLIKRFLGRLGYVMLKQATLDRLTLGQGRVHDFAFLSALPRSQAGELLELLGESQAQLRQDLFVLSELGFKRNGFFVEFGAASGRELSNTWLLEKRFGWNGILAEPAPCWHRVLAENRTCAIDHDCVWKNTGETLQFLEADDAEISTLAAHQTSDAHAAFRQSARSYTVRTISLLDLLSKHGAPAEMDYLSIDTEGSELEILEAFDFDRYRFRVITCEHNHTAAREKIHSLFTAAGYVRKYQEISQFDDWYVSISRP
jgi:FkbM family methyltransferase